MIGGAPELRAKLGPVVTRLGISPDHFGPGRWLRLSPPAVALQAEVQVPALALKAEIKDILCDENGLRWSYDPDGCCEIRKVRPLARALALFDASFTGRKGFQNAIRAGLARFELDQTDAAGRLKVNPLADWSSDQIADYFAATGLPAHPLVEQGYPSIGCSPCTSKVLPGEDPRAGRWKGWDKSECGIHSPVQLGADGELPPGYEPFL